VEAAALPKEMPTEVQHEDLLTEPWDMAIEEQETALSPYSVEESDTEKHSRSDRAQPWTSEPEQELNNDTVEYADSACPVLPQDIQTERSPVELLIYTFQTAADWSEISSGLKIHGEYKQQAWEALTSLERKRVMAITPPEIKKLNQAKKSGKIVNFYEVCSGVYQVQIQGSIFSEPVSSSTLDAFLMEL